MSRIILPKENVISIDAARLRRGPDECEIMSGILKKSNRPRSSKNTRKQKIPTMPSESKIRNGNEPIKKRRRKRKRVAPIEKMEFPMQVPTRFAFSVKKPVDIKDHDFVYNYLSIQTNMTMCCVCLQNNSINQMQSIITGTECNDFGRIFSIVLNLSESDILSPYCCTQCSDKVLDCFNALLEVNLAVCSSLSNYNYDRSMKTRPEFMCALCRCKMNSQQQLIDHVMLHAVDPLPALPIEQPISDRAQVMISVSENIEEGELVPLNLNKNPDSASTTPLELDEHCYSAKRIKTPTSYEKPELGLCHICGETRGSRQVLTRHINSHSHSHRPRTLNRVARCYICKTIIIDRLAMHQHLREVHNIEDKLPKKLKKCRLCELQFASAQRRNYHEQTDHVVEGFICPVCPKKFILYVGVVGHCRQMHSLNLSGNKPVSKEKKKRKSKKMVDSIIHPTKKCQNDVPSDDYYTYEVLSECENNEDDNAENLASVNQESFTSYPILETDAKVSEADVVEEYDQYIVDYIDGHEYYEELVSTFPTSS